MNVSLMTDALRLTTSHHSKSYLGLQLAYDLITRYGIFPVFLIGIPGNLLAFLVSMKKENRHISTCRYMAGLALMDSIVLFGDLTFGFIFRWNLGREKVHNPGATYNAWYYLNDSAAICSGFFLVEMSFDRLIAIWSPMNASRYCTPSRANKIMAVTTIIPFLVQINFFFTWDYAVDPVTGISYGETAYPNKRYVASILTAISIAFGCVIPFVLILASNAAIIVITARASRQRTALAQTEIKTEPRDRKGKQMMRMLLLVSLTYVVCSIPLRLFDFVIQLPYFSAMYDFSNLYWLYLYYIEYVSLVILWDCNYALNFYMYFLGGGKRFRNDTKDILRGILNCRL